MGEWNKNSTLAGISDLLKNKHVGVSVIYVLCSFRQNSIEVDKYN